MAGKSAHAVFGDFSNSFPACQNTTPNSPAQPHGLSETDLYDRQVSVEWKDTRSRLSEQFGVGGRRCQAACARTSARSWAFGWAR